MRIKNGGEGDLHGIAREKGKGRVIMTRIGEEGILRKNHIEIESRQRFGEKSVNLINRNYKGG